MPFTRNRWLVLGLAVAAGLAIIVGLRVRRGGPDDIERVWTTDALPRLPEPAENGWQLVADAKADLPIDFPTEHLGDVSALLAEPDTVWTKLDEQDSTLSPIIAAFKQSAYRDVWHRARVLRRFADAQRDEAGDIEVLLSHLHRVAVLDFLLDARGGHWDEALEGMQRLLEIELDYQASARDVLAQSLAATMLADGMSATVALVDRATAEGVEQSLREQLRATAIAAEFEPHVDRMVVLQYARLTDGLDRLVAESETPAAILSPSAWLFSPKNTSVEFNRYFRALMPAVVDGTTPPAAPAAEHCPLRFDPVGCAFLALAEVASVLPDRGEHVIQTLQRASAAQARLR